MPSLGDADFTWCFITAEVAFLFFPPLSLLVLQQVVADPAMLSTTFIFLSTSQSFLAFDLMQSVGFLQLGCLLLTS